ncbi:uncharacterized protein LOC133904586 [Phragmites australis]|uniref:uncharacterized protein LOC133904586 n=1 Tax=Phragmites australis TaxID=29695 RepID=UPI002D77768F|nr:uncharacterized protein LOC133904586 [Phragmites australis]
MAQQPPGEATTYTVKEITEAVAFLQKIGACFKTNPHVRDEFFTLITGLGEGGGDARTVAARASELLGDQPDLLAEFRAFLPGAEVSNEDVAAARTRRSSRAMERNSRCRPVVPTAEPNVGAGAGDAQGYGLLPEREREGGRRAAAGVCGAGGDAHEDPRLREAVEFLRWVLEHAGTEVYSKSLKVVFDAGDDNSMDANVIYERAREAFGPAYGHLLRGFCGYLPGRAEWEEQEARRQAPKRKHATDADTPSRAAKTPSADDGSSRHALHIGECSGGGAAWRGHDDYDVPPYRPAKKPRADDYNRRISHRVGEGSSTGATARGQCRRYSTGECSSAGAAARARGPDDDEFLRFRAAWKFETDYSILVATMARAEQLLQEPADEASLEELFPSRECQEFLERFYGEEWWGFRKALENGNRTGPALEVVLRRLRRKEEDAIEDARGRQDPARAAVRLNELVTERLDKERHRRTLVITVHERRAWPAVTSSIT